jgi:hypothetical protein
MSKIMSLCEKICRLVLSMYQHHMHGKAMTLTGWKMVLREDFSVRMEDTLVSPMVCDVMDVFPCGTYECGCCGQQHTMSQVERCMFDPVSQHMTCMECHTLHKPPLASMLTYTLDWKESMEVEPSEYIELEDCRPSEDAKKDSRDTFHAICAKFAQTQGLTFLDGKSIADLRRAQLARRVFRRWRAFVHKRWVLKTFRVLYSQKLNVDAAMTLAIRATSH